MHKTDLNQLVFANANADRKQYQAKSSKSNIISVWIIRLNMLNKLNSSCHISDKPSTDDITNSANIVTANAFTVTAVAAVTTDFAYCYNNHHIYQVIK